MTYSRPSVVPEFATNNINNGLLGAPNVQEPPLGTKQSGWNYGQKPEREYFNWLHRVTYQWINYLDEQVTAFIAFMNNTTDNTKNKTAADADNYFRSQW